MLYQIYNPPESQSVVAGEIIISFLHILHKL